MKQKYKNIILTLCTAVVISFLVSVLISYKSAEDIDGTICDTALTGENVVSLICNDKTISVIMSDFDGNEKKSVSYPVETKKEKMYVNNVCNDIICSDENVFVHMVSYYSDGRMCDEKIMLCDFSDGSLKEEWNIPYCNERTDEAVYGCRIMNDNLFYIMKKNNNTAVLYSASQNDSYSEKKQVSYDYNITDWCITDNLDMIGYSAYQGIFNFSDENSEMLYPDYDTEKINLVNFGYDEKGNIYLSDLLTGRNIKYSGNLTGYESSDIVYNTVCEISEETENIEFSDIKNISYKSDGNFSAVCDKIDRNGMTFISCNGDKSVIEAFNFKKFRFNEILKKFAVCSVIICISALIFCFYYEKNMYISISVKITFLFSLIMFAGMNIIINDIENTMRENLKNDAYSIMYHNIENSGTNLVSEALYGNDISQKLFETFHYKVYDMEADNEIIINTDGINNVPAEYILDNTSLEFYEEAYNSFTLLTDEKTGDYYKIVYPVEYDDKVYLVEMELKKYAVNSAVSQHMEDIRIMIIVSSLVFIILFAAVLNFFLKPIRTLAWKIKKYGSKAIIKTSEKGYFKDEIKEINDVFAHMIANVSEYHDKIYESNETYYKFLPSEIFSIFEKNNISEFKAGNSRKVMYCNVYIDISSADNEAIENNYSDFLIKDEKSECIIENFNQKYIEISFRYNYENILHHIISITEKFQNVYTGICYGSSIIAIAGDKERLQPMIISGHKKIAYMLAEIGKKYNRNLIVSEYFIKYIGNSAGNTLIRCIGHIKCDENYVKIYDVISINKNHSVYIKTKEAFEKGINYFLQMDFRKSKSCFVEVLKYNKEDVIAKEYLSACEAYIDNSANIVTDILL